MCMGPYVSTRLLRPDRTSEGTTTMGGFMRGTSSAWVHRLGRSGAIGKGTVALVAVVTALTAGSAISGASPGSRHSGSHGSQVGAASYSRLVALARQEFPTTYKGPKASVAAPKAVKVALITCSSQLHGCVSPAIGVTDAIESLDTHGYRWTAHTYDGGGTAQQQNAQMIAAISSGAKVIINIAIDPNAVQAGMRAAKRAGVLVGAGSNGLNTPNPVIKPATGNLGYAFDVSPDYGKLGLKAAEWIIGTSKGRANIAVYSDKEFPSVLALQRGLLAGLAACKTCVQHSLQYFTGTQVGTTLQQETTGFLRSNPNVNYLFSPYDPAAAAQVQAISQAGMGNVKLVSVLGDAQNLGYIHSGQVQVADAVYDNEYMGFAIVDQVIRKLDHKVLASPEGENVPFAIVDKSNLPKSGSDWHASFKYSDVFLKLWTGK